MKDKQQAISRGSAWRNRYVRMIALLLALALVVAACGSDSTGGGTDTTEGGTDTTEGGTDTTEGGTDTTEGGTDTTGATVEPEYELRWATNASPNTAKAEEEMLLAQTITDLSGGRIVIEHAWDGSLGAEQEALSNAAAGTVDFGLASSGNASAIVPEYAVLDLPFMIDGWEGMELFLASDAWEEIQVNAEAAGLKHVGQIVEGFRHLFTTDVEVVEPPDLDGVRLRVTQSPIEAAYVSALGADPTVVDWGETYLALKQGTVSGYHVAYSSVVQFGMSDVIGHVNEYATVPIISPLFMNLDLYNSMPPDLQEAIDSAGAEALPGIIDIALSAEDDFKAELVDEWGVQITTPDEALRGEFIALVDSVYTDNADLYPEGWLDRVADAQS